MRFSEILLIATAVTGGVWLLDTLFFRHKRMMNVLSPSRDGQSNEPWWLEYSKSFFPILLIVFILRSFLAEPFRIPSGSMHPTLVEGDFIVVNKYDYGLKVPLSGFRLIEIGAPKRGDVIVFKHEENGESIDMIKRVIGLPNDHIQYKDKTLYINGEVIKQDFIADKTDTNERGVTSSVRELREHLDQVKHDIYVQPATNHLGSYYQYDDVIVPQNSYFVMGDNRDNSKDSRIWGFVKDQDVQGRAFAIWMSWDPLGHKVRWDRIFSYIP